MKTSTFMQIPRIDEDFVFVENSAIHKAVGPQKVFRLFMTINKLYSLRLFSCPRVFAILLRTECNDSEGDITN